MHIYMCQTSDNPILPVEAKWNGKKWEYTAMLDMTECFGSYGMAYVNYTVACHQQADPGERWEHPIESLRCAFGSRNPVAAHLMWLLSSKTIYPNGSTPFEVQYSTSGTTVSAATLHRLHSVLN